MGTLELDIEKGLFLGVDFGTTNSVVSIYNFIEGESQTIPIDGSNIFPTAIQFELDMEDENKLVRIFGNQAKEGAIIYPESTVISIKRLLNDNLPIKLNIEEKEFSFTPVQLVGEILEYLKQKADDYVREELNLEGEFSGCVITVPANSTDKQKSLTKKAAILAGFDENSIYIRLEPAAAAISYAINETEDKKVLIYDFGGGTFDACILEIKIDEQDEPSISILSTYGDNNLGGNDIDKIMMDIIYQEFKNLTNDEIDLFDDNVEDGMSIRQKKVARIRLQQFATQTKERLSHSKNAKVTLSPFIQEPKIVNINMEITREYFLSHNRINQLDDDLDIFKKFENKSVIDIIQSTIDCIDNCIKESGISENDIDEIFLVGGSSSLPLVTEKIFEKFKKEPFRAKISPALSISQGAAYYCNMIMTPTINGPIVHEKTVHSLGLEIAGRRYMEIVKQGVDIPKEGLLVEAKELLQTNYDNISSMAIIVYENTEPSSDETNLMVNKSYMKRLAGTSLTGIPQASKGNEKVKVIFNVSQENILTVTAKSMSTNGLETELSVDELY